MIWFIGAILTIGFVGHYSLNELKNRNLDIAAAERDTANLVNVTSENFSRKLSLADRTLRDAMDGVRRAEYRTADVSEINSIIRKTLGDSPIIREIFITNETGLTTHSSDPLRPTGYSFASEDFFQRLVNDNDTRLTLGIETHPLSGQLPTIVLARKRLDAAGTFIGIAAASLEYETFSATLRSIDPGANGAVSFWRRDGVLLARNTPLDVGSQRNFQASSPLFRDIIAKTPAGTTDLISPVDNVERILSFRSLAQFDAVVVVAFAKDTVLTHWRNSAIANAIGVVALVLTLVVLLGVLDRYIRRTGMANRQLARNERRLSEFAATSSDWFYELDADLRFTFMSETIEMVTGVKAQAYLGRRPDEFGNSNPATRAFWALHMPVLRSHTPFRNLDFPTAEGKKGRRILSISGKPIFDEDGQFLGYRGTGADVTVIRQSVAKAERTERQLFEAFEVLPDTVVITDLPEGRVLFGNHHARKAFNFDYRNDQKPVLVTDFLANKADGRRIYEAMMRDGRIDNMEVQMRTQSGKLLWVVLSSQFFEFQDQRACLTIATDISALQHAAEEMREAKLAAEAANRAKSVFLANMSHELRTPLNAIMGFSEIISRGLFGPISHRYADYANDISASGKHLLNVINDILDLSKVEAGKLELREDSFQLAEAIEACRSLVAARAEQGKKTLDIHSIDPALVLRADPLRFRQMMLNLLSNAVKFSNEGGSIYVAAKREPDGGLSISVADDGIGMTVADRAKALEPFQQIDSGLARTFEGSGLGLPLTRALIELHGGRLSIEGDLGKGTTVSLFFPAARVSS